jgi:hypothetical protein
MIYLLMDAVGMDEKLSSEAVEEHIAELTDRFVFSEEATAASEMRILELQ